MKKLFSETVTLFLFASSLTAFSQEKAIQNANDSTSAVVRTDSSAQASQKTAVVDTSVSKVPVSQDTVTKVDSSVTLPAKTVLLINSTPPGAAVLLNDSVLGITPVTVPDVAPGNYSLVLKMKGYYQKKSEISITGKDSQTVNFELLKPAMVIYMSKPDGVAISANGKERGKTPFVDSLVKPGNYLIQGTLEKYDIVLKNITVKNGAVDTIMLEMIKTGEKKQTAAPVTAAAEKKISPLRKYSGIIGAVAFAIFSCVLLIAERDNL
jgi:hypothetical protein